MKDRCPIREPHLFVSLCVVREARRQRQLENPKVKQAVSVHRRNIVRLRKRLAESHTPNCRRMS